MPAPAYDYSGMPTAISAPASQVLYTAYQFLQDSPAQRRILMSRHGMQRTFFAMLKELGLGSPCSFPKVSHREKDWIKNNFVIGTIVTAPAGAGATGVYALDTGSMYTTNLEGIGNVSFSYPSVGEIVYLKNGKRARIKEKNTDVSPHQLTLEPENTDDTLVGAVVAGQRYFLGDNAMPEGSRGVAPKVPRYISYENDFQIIKAKFTETGTSLTNKLPFVQISGKEGSFIVDGTSDTEKLQMDRISHALFFGDKNNNFKGYSEALGMNIPIKTTQGMDKYIEQEGTIITHTPGAYALDDFDVYAEVLKREKVSSKAILMPMANALQTEINNVLVDFIKNDQAFLQAASAFKGAGWANPNDARDHFAWLDFQGIHKNGFNWLFRYEPILDDQMGAGTEGYDWRNTGYAIPLESMNNGKGTKKYTPTIGFEYKALNGYSREFEMYKHGGAGPIDKTTDLDAFNLEFRSEVAFHGGLGNHMIKMSPAA